MRSLSSAAPRGMGDTDVRDEYERNGFVVIEGALHRDELAALLSEAAAICRGERGRVFGLDPAASDEDDHAVMARYLAVHQPHKISKVVVDVLKHPRVVDAMTALIGPNVKSMQSMLFVKPAGMPGQAWHQDEFFIPTRDRSLCGVWIALDDATVDNGCLWVIPGSHRRGVVYAMRRHEDERFDLGEEAFGFPHDEGDAVPVELRAGDALAFNGYLLHRSLPNRAPAGTFRRSLVNHYMSAESLLPWNTVHTGSDDFRDIVMVAGEDPYAWKGTIEFHKPHLRVVDQAQREAMLRDRLAAQQATQPVQEEART